MLPPWRISHRYPFLICFLLSPLSVFTNFDEYVKLIIEFWTPIFPLAIKSFILEMKSPPELPNVDRWIVDFWEDVFIERHLWVHRFRQRCQVNHGILSTYSVVGVKIIYIRNEVTNRVTECWPLVVWLLGRIIYWETAMRYPILTTMSI